MIRVVLGVPHAPSQVSQVGVSHLSIGCGAAPGDVGLVLGLHRIADRTEQSVAVAGGHHRVTSIVSGLASTRDLQIDHSNVSPASRRTYCTSSLEILFCATRPRNNSRRAAS